MTEPASHPSVAWWDLTRADAYRTWREQTLDESPASLTPVPLSDPTRLSMTEIKALTARLRAGEVVLYQTDRELEPRDILALGAQLGLRHLDHHQCAEPNGVARLTTREDGAAKFIPYTRHRLRWHTDGYYRPDTQRIRSFILHCIRPAVDGGINQILDSRLLYIALRDEDPDLIRALSHPRAFTIPAHTEEGEQRRNEFDGPVFSAEGPHLYMRYTERSVHIAWHPATETARTRIQQLLKTLPPARCRLRLHEGCGLIAHNVLHCRSAYTDSPKHPRLLYRTRYTDRTCPHADPE